MNFHGITYPDLNNGLGNRVTLWVSGCVHHCIGCHNKETWDALSGNVFTEEKKLELFKILNFTYIQGITFSGGEPISLLKDDKYLTIINIMKEIKQRFPTKDIWCYTGYTFSKIPKEYLKYVDVFVTEPFKIREKDLTLPFRGSRNQKILSYNKNIDSWEEIY